MKKSTTKRNVINRAAFNYKKINTSISALFYKNIIYNTP